MGLLRFSTPLSWQPQGPARPNFELLGKDAIVWSATNRQTLQSLLQRYAASSEGSPQGKTPGKPGTGVSWGRSANAGLDFGTVQPLTSDSGVTILVVAQPTASANRKIVFSQRFNSGGVQQFGVWFNATATVGAGSGYVTLYCRNTAGTAAAVTATAGGIDGNVHCWVFSNSTVASSGYAFRDGVSLTLTTNTAMSGTYVSASQKTAVGNAAAYTTDGALVLDEPLYLIIAWPRMLPPEEARNLSDLLSRNLGWAFSPYTVSLPTLSASGSTGTGAFTNADDTLVASGTTTVLGTVSFTETPDTLAAAGEAGSATGVGSVLNADDTLSASGTTTVLGVIAFNNADDTLSAAGTTTVLGVVTFTNGDDGLVAAGTSGTVVTTFPPVAVYVGGNIAIGTDGTPVVILF